MLNIISLQCNKGSCRLELMLLFVTLLSVSHLDTFYSDLMVFSLLNRVTVLITDCSELACFLKGSFQVLLGLA